MSDKKGRDDINYFDDELENDSIENTNKNIENEKNVHNELRHKQTDDDDFFGDISFDDLYELKAPEKTTEKKFQEKQSEKQAEIQTEKKSKTVDSAEIDSFLVEDKTEENESTTSKKTKLTKKQKKEKKAYKIKDKKAEKLCEETEAVSESEKTDTDENETEQTEKHEVFLTTDFIDIIKKYSLSLFKTIEFILLVFYKNTYYLGIQVMRFTKKFRRVFGKQAVKPFKFFIAIFRMIIIAADHILFKSFHTLTEEISYLRYEIKTVRGIIKEARKTSHLHAFRMLLRYVRTAFVKHSRLFKSAANTLLPITAVIVLLYTINYWNGAVFALNVMYNDKSIGYISDESIFIEAQDMVKKRLSSNEEDGENVIEVTEAFARPTYKLSLITLNELTDARTISNRMIENTSSNLVSACGVYIDNDFLCSVKNETDAKSVFSNILAEYEKEYGKEKDTIIGFVENVKYTQGYYPDEKETMWDAARLSEKLNTDKESAVYYTVVSGDTLYDIAKKYDMTEAKIVAMNKNLGESIHEGDKVLISNRVKYIQVKVSKVEKRKGEVAFETIKTENSSRFRGDNRVTRTGVKGEVEITELVTYVNGLRVSAKEVSRVKTKEPVAEKIEVGTKSTKVYTESGSYNVKPSGKGFVWPCPTLHGISTYYGRHTGIDITGSGASGKLIVAANDGVVELVSFSNRSYGNQIVINHGNGIKTRYAHCLSGSISVKVGQRVSAGQAIARVGNTGNSSGPHLHFEVIVGGRTKNPLNYVSR